MLPPTAAGGPHNLGDPDDKTLRKVEREILIPKKLRDRTRLEKCVEEVQIFSECCKAAGLLMSWKCKSQTNAMNSCLERWYHDEKFKEECKQQYLQERSEYRRTGIKKKFRRKETTTI